MINNLFQGPSGEIRRGYFFNYEKHAPRASQVIAAVAKVSCKHGLWLVARVNKEVETVKNLLRLLSPHLVL